MPTNTYVALDKVTVGTATPSITFSSIPSTYTDLVIVSNSTPTTSGGVDLYLTVNGDTTSGLYSKTHLAGYSSSAGSTRLTNQNRIATFWQVGPDNTQPFLVNYSIQNYANTSVFKTVLARAGAFQSSASEVNAFVGLWRNTNAITSVTLTVSSGNFASGSTFSLYGIRAEGVSPAPKATGGAIYSDSQYYYHVFGSTGTFTPLQSLSVDALVVAGGGGSYYGGAGAGGARTSTGLSVTTTAYTVTVGAGGGFNADGTSSTFSTITSSGGARAILTGNGIAGGSGSGGTSVSGDPAATGGAGNSGSYSPVEGYAGGNAQAAAALANQNAGGGGGAGGVGGNGTASTSVGGNGGIGLTSSLINAIGAATGTGQLVSGNYYFAGGGGGGGNTPGTGGSGGGGTGTSAGAAGAGTVNTGGGAGSGKYPATTNAAGGSGIVIVRYAK